MQVLNLLNLGGYLGGYMPPFFLLLFFVLCPLYLHMISA